MHRFWLSVTLAASSIASPLNAKLWAHDLPWRWTSDTVSSSDWNYLRDDCLDSRTRLGYADALSKFSSCPTEDAAVANRFDAVLAHKTLAGFHRDIGCWANQWESMQRKAVEVARARLVSQHQTFATRWAARPDFGVPPAPAIPVVDTCGFEAEYQAMQAAADLLNAEVARAAAISSAEAELQRSLAAAAKIEAAAIDAIPEITPAPASCGALDAIVSEQRPFNASEQRPYSDFAPGFAADRNDEYAAYDLDGHDAHWLGGLSKSWKLRSALSAAAPAPASASAPAPADGAVASEAAECFGADEFAETTIADSQAAAIADLGDNSDFDSASNIIEPPMIDDALDMASAAAIATTAAIEMTVRFEWPLDDYLAAGLEWVDQASCTVAAEMCGMDLAQNLGEQWAGLSLAGADQAMSNYVAMGQYLNLPPMVFEPTLEQAPVPQSYVVYTDTEGNQTTVPSSLARAWNRPERDASLDESSYLQDELAVMDSSKASAPAAATQAAADATAEAALAAPAASLDSPAVASSGTGFLNGVDLSQLRRMLLTVAARRLDSLGVSCLETADQLSNWAETQIASRDDADVR
jgi:hypothetical protein